MRRLGPATRVASLTTALLLPTAAATDVATEDTRTFGDWTTGVLINGDQRIHRAAVSSGDGPTLLVDRFTNQCSEYQLTITETIEEAPSEDVRVSIDDVFVQVDHLEPHAASGIVTVAGGDTRAFMEVTLESPGALHAEIGHGQQLAVMVRNQSGKTETETFSLDGSLDALSRNRERCHDESVSVASEADLSDDRPGSGASSGGSAGPDSERDRRLQMLEDFRFSLSGCVSMALPDARQLEAWYATAREAASELERRIRVEHECSVEAVEQHFEELQDLAERLGGRMTVSWKGETVRTRIQLPEPYYARVNALRDEILEDMKEAGEDTEAKLERANEIMEDFEARW